MQEEFLEEVEEWRAVVGYEGYYEISSIGRIRGVDRNITRKDGVKAFVRGKILAPNKTQSGYLFVDLGMERKRHDFKVHRLVATAFIPNPENKPEVNHINGIKTDNRLSNLEWVTHKENMIHASKIGLMDNRSVRIGSNNVRSIPVDIYEVYIKKVGSFANKREAYEATGYSERQMANDLHNKPYRAGTFIATKKDSIVCDLNEYMSWRTVRLDN